MALWILSLCIMAIEAWGSIYFFDTFMERKRAGQAGKPLVLQNYIFGSGCMYEVLNRLGNLKERVE